MLIHVQNDPTLHGNLVTVADLPRQGQALLEKILYAGNTASVAEAMRIGKDSTVVSIAASGSSVPSLRLSQELQEKLRLPNSMTLHCVRDGETWRIGPCLGIYVSSYRNRKLRFGPQTRLLKDLAVAAGEIGVDVVVIGPGYINTRQGWRYNVFTSNWEVSEVAHPDVVLRRSGAFEPTQATLVRADLQSFAAEGILHTLPRFYTNKWMMHRLLSQNSDLEGYLLNTYLAQTADEVFRLAYKHSDVYVKLLTGAQGHGIYHIRRTNNGLRIDWNRSPSKNGKTIAKQQQFCFDLQDFVDFWNATGVKKCIVQETFPLPLTRDGYPFDLRWLIQFTDRPVVTARMARVGFVDSVTTNLHTGGKPVEAKDLFQSLKWQRSNALLSRLDEVAVRVTQTCTEKFGPIAELGVDLAVNERGDIRIFEINSTPGRRMLKLAAPTLRTLSLHNLLEYAINAAGFTGES
ncbi:YheC/YheD family protein [Alicyclobacillus sp. SO9]|uniref:YheC/YheD family protein n=1 Tax=Alicyclobacillus sp. SO9 TaxID=2665646 RepID=UPI0018E8B3D4|nr:YheC/YheD family protein [Alicyclobacillus sp. SO9]QQE80949.1 YheC/YheD family protein [Alicyclobacillus sp. SO9]